MKKILALTALIATSTFALTSMADTSKTYDLSGFDEIRASAGIDVVLSQGDTHAVVADFERGGPDDISVRVDGDQLIMKRKSNGFWRENKARVTLRVTAPEIDGIEASSGTSVRAEGINAADMQLAVSSGASVSLSGDCDSATVQASSGASLSAQDFECEAVTAKASSGASVSIFASQTSDSHTSSGASVTVYGDPADRQANKSMSGGSTRYR